jgi:uncharacterized Zn-binding protein involved in type VI secretion
MLQRMPLVLLMAASTAFVSGLALAANGDATSTGNLAVSQTNYKAGAISFNGPETLTAV